VWDSFSHGGRAIYREANFRAIRLPDGFRVGGSYPEVWEAFVTTLAGSWRGIRTSVLHDS
jgi:hypothetical protein